MLWLQLAALTFARSALLLLAMYSTRRRFLALELLLTGILFLNKPMFPTRRVLSQWR
ncbi:uncharacterized protein BKA55DRAFT_569271 [Fusarium redolens]|uniref:Uncharacterized protein n=1 Tax=Fusarium redolens TaxID=48865 RepID=A0A9P9KAS8_FUSRE|nr:uncharacterized protein BKA55DRAFT_569271 [Fusarium redolens]KAH7250361.1 hypothetical protein BKA55DRAFT_569271 [Fusarium redolens]